MDSERTIAAVSTPAGRGGVAVIRISGPDAFAVAGKVTGRSIDAKMAGTFFRAKFRNLDGRVMDDGIALVFAGPNSYTGEDVVELQGHGGALAPRQVLEAVVAAGARLARRGEFTERAFLNGKLDLSEAEAVIDLIDARTNRSALDARRRLEGGQRTAFEKMYAVALEISAELEHALDFSEDELPPDFTARIRRRSRRVGKMMEEALSTAREGKILREGALVVLSGEPNVGKSSLLNALLNENRAIVSDVAGTTRDSIEESLDLEGWPVRLVDTAGIRSTADSIEAEGVRRSERLIAEADIVLRLVNAGDVVKFMESGEELNDKDILVFTKVDLQKRFSVANALAVSSLTGEGLAKLKRTIVARLESLSAKGDEDAPDVTARQCELLQTALAAHRRGVEQLDFDLVLAANEFRSAADALGRLSGKTYSDDLLDAVFSRFCVGK